jgi:diguanylate cyclase (GGDEF)-like protein
MSLNDLKKEFKKTYDLDFLNDVILNRDDQIILFMDESNDSSMLICANGTLNKIGFSNAKTINIEAFFDVFDYQNAYATVRGEKEYFKEVKDQLLDYTREINVTFPIFIHDRKYWLRFHRVPIKKNVRYHSIFITDVTRYLVEEEALFHKTHHDSLTGLFNRYTLDYHYGERYQMDVFHVMYLDLDNFKMFNDSLGHHAGNTYLQEFAMILKSHESNYNRFYRLGGDEFVGLIFESSDKVKDMATSISEMTRKLSKQSNFTDTSVSIGIIQATKREDVIKKADKLMYKAKSKGKNQWLFEVEQ